MRNEQVPYNRKESIKRIQLLLEINKVEGEAYKEFMQLKHEEMCDEFLSNLEKEFMKYNSIKDLIKIKKPINYQIVPKLLLMNIIGPGKSSKTEPTNLKNIKSSKVANLWDQIVQDLKNKTTTNIDEVIQGDQTNSAKKNSNNFDSFSKAVTFQSAINSPEDDLNSPEPVKQLIRGTSNAGFPRAGDSTFRFKDSTTKHAAKNFMSLLQVSRAAEKNLNKKVVVKDISDSGFEARPASRESFLMVFRSDHRGTPCDLVFLGGIGSDLISTYESYSIGRLV